MRNKRKTLHEAIKIVLKNNGNEPLTYDEIAAEINSAGLYHRIKDNNPLRGEQVRLRTYVQKKYKHLFVVENDKTVKLSGCWVFN